MSNLHDDLARQLLTLMREISTDKVMIRNKAIDHLNNILTSNKDEIFYIISDTKYSDLHWSDLYSAATEAILYHSQKLDDPNGKGFQTTKNKNAIYAAVVNKIIEYNIESTNCKKISSNALYHGILTILKNRTSRQYFGTILLNITEITIFSESLLMLSDMKINDYVELISLIFEMAKKDNNHIVAGLKSVIKGIELGIKNFQCTQSFFETLNYVKLFTQKAGKDEKIFDLVLKLNIIILKELSIEGHQTVCEYYQDMINDFCTFYKYRMRPETKHILFEIFQLFLNIHYPNLEYGDSTLLIESTIDWEKINRKLFYIIETEIKERFANFMTCEEVDDLFENLATSVIYLQYFKVNKNSSDENNIMTQNEDGSSVAKISRQSSNLEDLLTYIKLNNRYNNQPIWFFMFAKLILRQPNLIDITNYSSILKLTIKFFFRNFDLLCDIENVRILTEILLFKEKEFIKSEIITKELFEKLWNQFVEFFINDNRQLESEAAAEIQTLSQLLIKYEKISFETCTNILQNFIQTKQLRNENNLKTVKQILISYGVSTVQRNDLKQFIEQLYCESNKIEINKNNVKNNQKPETTDEMLNLLGEITIILVLNNFENVKENTDILLSSVEINNKFIIQNIQFKYMKNFIALESRTKMADDIDSIKCLPNINYLNEKNFEMLLQYSQTQLDENSKLMENFLKIEKLIILNKKFTDYNIVNTNSEKCQLTKRFGLLYQQIEKQLISLNLNILEMMDIMEILTKLKYVILINKKSSFKIMDQNILQIFNFVKSCLKKFHESKPNNQDSESLEILENLSCLGIEIIAILTIYNGFKENIFEPIKDYDFFKISKATKRIELFFKILNIFTYENELKVEDHDLAEWIIQNLETVCKNFHSNFKISSKIIDSILNICKSFKNFINYVEDIFIIMSSFLKICYKAKFNAGFNCKVILLFKDIARIYPDLILENDDIQQLYLSIGKFLLLPSLLVQFAVIEYMSYIMDPTWIFKDSIIPEKYFQFSKDLYYKIDLRKLLKNIDNEEELPSIDSKRNINSSIIQLYLSIYTFSYTNSKLGFLELADITNCQNLNQNQFHDIQKFSKYLNCELKTISVDSAENLISLWLKQHFELEKLPWYLCSNNEISFYKDNFKLLTFHSLKNSIEYIPKISQKIHFDKKILIEKSLEISYAFALPYMLNLVNAGSDYSLINTDYINEAENLIKNLQKYNINLRSILNKLDISNIIFELTRNFTDNLKFKQLIGENLNLNNIEDFDYDIYQQTLKNIIGQNFNKFTKFAIEYPLVIIKLNKKLKKKIYMSIFIDERLLYLCRYFTIVDLMEVTLDDSKINLFFLKDILLFIANILKKFNCCYLVLKSTLYFLENLLKQLLNIKELESPILTVINQIIEIAENIHQNNNILNICLKSLENVFCLVIELKNDFLQKLEPLMEKEIFKGTPIEFHANKTPSITKETIERDLDDFFESNLKNSYNISKLKINIIKKKDAFIKLSSNEYLSKLLKILMETIINGSKKEVNSAAECLGVIGPIFINKYAFVKEEIDFVSHQNIGFITNTLKSIEKLLFNYDLKTYPLVLDVANLIANSNFFEEYASDLEHFFLQPFINNKKNATKINLEFSIKEHIDFKKILFENERETQENFIKNLTSKIFESIKFLEFAKLSLESFQFSQSIILTLINLLLKESHGFEVILIEMLNNFFDESNKAILNKNTKLKKNYLNKKTIKLFLDIIESYRIFNKFKVQINMINVANVALYQEAHFLAIFYLELWALERQESSDYTETNETLRQNKEFQNIALTAYKAINCKEAINGFLDPIESRLEYFNINNDWTDILIELDASQCLQNSQMFLDILKRNGLLTLSNSMNLEKSNEIDYETCWRLANWDITALEDQKQNESFQNLNSLQILQYHFEKNHYQALKSIRDKDETNTLRSIQKAREFVIKILKEISIESIQNVYKYLADLMLLRQIDDFAKIQFSTPTNFEIYLPDCIFRNWDVEQKMRYGNFSNKEITLAQKIILLQSPGTRASRKINEFYKDDYVVAKYLFNMVEECNSNDEHFCLAKRYITILKTLDVNEELKAKIDLVDANICLKNGKKSMALAILQNMIKSGIKSTNILYNIEAHRLYGEYLADDNDESFDDINEKYFAKVTHKLEGARRLMQEGKITFDQNIYIQMKKNIYYTIATYADKEYQRIDSYIKSENFKKSKEIMEQYKKDFRVIKQHHKDLPDTRETNECLLFLNGNANLDKNQIDYFETNHDKYLKLAIHNYIEFCKMDDAIISPAIYRIIGLWFSNKDNDSLANTITSKLFEIPSYKFLCILSQLTAQLHSKQESFIIILKKIIIKCAIDYPHHTLNHILSLSYASEDIQYTSKLQKSSSQTSTSSSSQDNSRVKLVHEIIHSIEKNKKCLEIIRQTQKMFVILIECAYWNMRDKDDKTPVILKITKNLQKLKNLDKVHCPTVGLPISNVVKDDIDIVSIHGWDTDYETVGGVNAPKKILCNCSDGTKRIQLLKGNDDLRQDAIMQQVLTFVNNLLRESNENFDQNLLIRTYKVVPLSKRSGLLEWCINTNTLGEYLCGKKDSKGKIIIIGAHEKYRTNDETPFRSRSFLCKYKLSPKEERIEAFKKVCQRIKPVLHYFFFEKFKTPGIWFERRLAYMNSVATTSMVGFILGLGDRHCQNMLLDKKTAEVIHIDFGIAFEKGKTMPTPETIPFRLTREIVAPMGICEVNGIFRKSCEQTLKILRNNHQVLLTILEVLLYDPLYSWSLNEKIINRINKDKGHEIKVVDDEEKNASAHRVLMRIQAKLEGRDDKQIGSLSVSRQVEKLIAEARNVTNLALVYPGWDQYL